MAKITIAGDSYVVTSSKTLEAIKNLEKYRPNALRLFQTDESGNKEEVFRVASTNGKGSINAYGASFGSVTHDDQKLATITGEIPAGVTNAKEWVAEKVGTAIIALNKVEAQFVGAQDEIAAEKATIMESISVAG